MYHFFVDPAQIGEDEIRITGEDVNHIKNVLRMRPGEEVLISSRSGGDYHCRVRELAPDVVFLSVEEKREDSRELPARIHLYQGLPKADKMDLIIQKAVELGAYRIVPVSTRRAVVRLDSKKEEAKLRRWNAVSESAAKQSGRSLIPEVSGLLSFSEALKEAESFGLKLIPYECAEGIGGTRRLIAQAEPGMDIAVFIGPDGGFEPDEIAQAGEAGVVPITLGRRILRTETAGLCILSALMLSLEREPEE